MLRLIDLAGDIAAVIIAAWLVVGFVSGFDFLAWSGRLDKSSSSVGNEWNLRSPSIALMVACVIAAVGLLVS